MTRQATPWSTVLEDEVRLALAGEPSGHDHHHALRVRDLGLELARRSGADRDVVEAAALLHDLGHVAGRDDHAASGAAAARSLLSGCGFPTEKIDAVIACIRHHHWRPGNAGDPADPSLEYQVFVDADRLDALGAIGIARTFSFGGAHGRPIWNPGAGEGSTIQHFHDKLLHLEHGMYTEAGRAVAERRTATLQRFLEAFFEEWELGDLGER